MKENSLILYYYHYNVVIIIYMQWCMKLIIECFTSNISQCTMCTCMHAGAINRKERAYVREDNTLAKAL